MNLPATTESTPEPTPAADDPSAGAAALRIRYRIRFAKTGLLRWISHRDLARLWERLLRRARLELSMTEGFHPKPRIAFPSALALGVESLDEVVEIELTRDMSAAELFRKLTEDDQPGLHIASVARLPDGFGKAHLSRSDYTISLVGDADVADVRSRIDQLASRRQVELERKNKTLTIDVASQILQLRVTRDSIELSLAASDSASLRPADVLELLGVHDWIEKGSLITRVRVTLEKEFDDTESPFYAAATLAASHNRDPHDGELKKRDMKDGGNPPA